MSEPLKLTATIEDKVTALEQTMNALFQRCLNLEVEKAALERTLDEALKPKETEKKAGTGPV